MEQEIKEGSSKEEDELVMLVGWVIAADEQQVVAIVKALGLSLVSEKHVS